MRVKRAGGYECAARAGICKPTPQPTRPRTHERGRRRALESGLGRRGRSGSGGGGRRRPSCSALRGTAGRAAEKEVNAAGGNDPRARPLAGAALGGPGPWRAQPGRSPPPPAAKGPTGRGRWASCVCTDGTDGARARACA